MQAKSEIRRPKSDGQESHGFTLRAFGFRPSDFFRISAFGFRILLMCLVLGPWSFFTLPALAQLTTRDPLMSLMISQPRIELGAPVIPTASFDPPVVRPGELSIYRVTFNALEELIEWPSQLNSQPKLELRPGGHAQVLQMLGPFMEPRTTFNYRVRSSETGQFVVPEFTVNVYGKPVTVPAARLEVTSSPATPAPAAQQLYLEMPATNLFAGQSVQLRVMLPGSPQGGIHGLAQVQIIGDGFIAEPSAAHQRIEKRDIGGANLVTLIYETLITPIAAGKLSLFAQAYSLGDRFSGAVVLPSPAILPGSFPQYILLDSEPLQVRVNPLPQKGQLPGFTGAIGAFTLDPPKLTTNVARVGEPLQLAVKVQGNGNLVRLVAPPPPDSRQWQIFPAHTEGASAQPFGPGWATLNYTLVPLDEAARATPAIPFSFFDPQEGRYVDLTIPSVPVTVKAGAVAADVQPLFETSSGEPDSENEPQLSDLALGPGRAASLVPLQHRAWFPAMQLAPVAVFVGLWFWDRRRRYLEQHPMILIRRRARRTFRRQCRALRQAARAGDAPRFASAAVTAMRVACAPHFPAEPRALVGGDVLELLAENGSPDSSYRATEVIRRFFSVTDADRFATSPVSAQELLTLQPELNQVLERLEARL